MISRIQNCYDSHAHFLATGQIAAGLRLQDLESAGDVAQLKIEPQHFRGSWLTGFGWDQNKWSDTNLPTKKDLDRIFQNGPVLFSRADGHASWINTRGLEQLKALNLPISPEAEATGLLFETDHVNALSGLPGFSDEQIKFFFVTAQKIFNAGGFTHVRDLSMTLRQWKILAELQRQQNLTVCVDAFVTAENFQRLDNVLNEISEMKNLMCPQLRVHGVKIFFDGSLGSKTAYLSENYLNLNHCGKRLWPLDQVKQLLRKTWQRGLEVAVHTIGDQAAHEIVEAAREISAEGILGRLHLEHVEILRPETVQLMKPLHVICYLQPSHWISDDPWLKRVVSPNLHKKIFQWELLRKNKIPFYFGSDSPIERPFLLSSQKALSLSAEKNVPALAEDWKNHHAHPDKKWTESWTEFDSEKILQVYFNETPIL